MKRGWFKINLSTALAILICVAAIAWMNSKRRDSFQNKIMIESVGWPLTHYTESVSTVAGPPDVSGIRVIPPRKKIKLYLPMVFNFAICALGLVAVAAMWEKLLERFQHRRFQFHLSTAVVLMIVAGVLLGSNLVPNNELHYDGKTICTWGWPYLFYEGWLDEQGRPASYSGMAYISPDRVHWAPLCINFLCAALFVLTAVTVSEFLGCRRERSRLPEEPQ